MTHKIVVSVPHTGTRFLKDRLGIEDHVHTNTNWEKISAEIEGRDIVVPLRNPHDVWRSWCRRRAEKDWGVWVAHFFLSWGVLHTIDQLRDVEVVCVDKRSDDRITDWQKVGDKDQSVPSWKPHHIDLRPVFKIPIVHKHYPSHLK